jgi:predicted transcriptional regulator
MRDRRGERIVLPDETCSDPKINAYRLYRDGMTYAQVGEYLGKSKLTARKYIEETRARLEAVRAALSERFKTPREFRSFAELDRWLEERSEAIRKASKVASINPLHLKALRLREQGLKWNMVGMEIGVSGATASKYAKTAKAALAELEAQKGGPK